LALAATLALSMSSCGIFDTRDSEPPNTEQPVPRVEPVNADAVIFNFVNAVGHFSQANYDETMAEDFKFTPDDADREFFISQDPEDIFKNWDKDEESSAVRKIFAESDTLTVMLEETNRTSGTDSLTITMEYVFRRVIPRVGAPDSVASFKGIADIHLREDQSGFWAIDRWKDTATTEEDQTWGFLKGKVTVG
jgi:hypothetical protein